MLKKISLVLLGVLLTLFAIIMFNTFRLGHTQLEPGVKLQLDVDKDGLVQRFSEAIQIKTVSTERGSNQNEAELRKFLKFIQQGFPLVHEKLGLKTFNEFTQLFYWEGSDAALAPILLMGHYDVVPVDSSHLPLWEFPPFSGAVEDGFIWGRGALDDKFTVMALLETAEYLLNNGFQPSRSMYFLFGHDEEIGGLDGAREVARYFEDRGTRFHFVLDEGGVVMPENPLADKPLALVGIAEKGYVSIELIARSGGGHSSQPPDELSVVMLSEAITRLHQNQFLPRFDGATKAMLHSVGSKLGFVNRMALANPWLFEGIMKKMMLKDPATAAMIRTTIAPTMLQAGIKDNVLPQEARAVINFRILPGDSFQKVVSHVESVIQNDKIEIRPYETFQSPVGLVSPVDDGRFGVIQQTIMNQFGDVLIVPYLVLGATDSRYFSSVSDHVYRFMPAEMEHDGLTRIHGNNERVSIRSYTGAVSFYASLIMEATQ